MGKRTFLLLLLALIGVGVFLSCEGSDEESYPSETEDLGKECGFTCYDDWCFKTNYPWCSAQICVGEPEELYCSIYCLNANSCPDGYTCTLNCDLNSPDTYCVTDDHYVLLIEQGVCPLLES